jgi:hypothetical protein
VGAALFAALAQSQAPAAATTALYRNQLVENTTGRRCCAVIELRQYTLVPGRFDDFTKLFEDEFVDPLEAAGMTGSASSATSRSEPLLWLRGFRDMPSRANRSRRSTAVRSGRRGAMKRTQTSPIPTMCCCCVQSAQNGGVDLVAQARRERCALPARIADSSWSRVLARRRRECVSGVLRAATATGA